MRPPNRCRCWRKCGALIGRPALLNLTGSGGVRLKFNLAEGRFVLRDILMQNVEQSFGLLRAQIDALKVLNVYGVGSGLADGAEHEEEIPKVDSDLHAVGVTIAIIGAVTQLDLGRLRGRHNSSILARVALEADAA